MQKVTRVLGATGVEALAEESSGGEPGPPGPLPELLPLGWHPYVGSRPARLTARLTTEPPPGRPAVGAESPAARPTAEPPKDRRGLKRTQEDQRTSVPGRRVGSDVKS